MSGEQAESRTELDSHADSTCVGCNAFVISDTGRDMDVSSFIEDLGVKNEVPIIIAVVSYGYTDGKNYLLIIHEAL